MGIMRKLLDIFSLNNRTGKIEYEGDGYKSDEAQLDKEAARNEVEHFTLVVDAERKELEEANDELIESIQEYGNTYVNFFNEIFHVHSVLKECWFAKDGSMEFIIEFDSLEQAEYIVAHEEELNQKMQLCHEMLLLDGNCVSIVIRENAEESPEEEGDIAEESVLDILDDSKEQEVEITQDIEVVEKKEGALNVLNSAGGVEKSESKGERQEDKEEKKFEYAFPVIDLLKKELDSKNSKEEIEQQTKKLKQTFCVFGVNAEIVSISFGARFTRFEIQIGKGVRIRDILKLEDDIKLGLGTTDLHIEAPIPGRTTIGIDIKNRELSTVTLREMIESKEFSGFPSALSIAVGKDITGNVIVESLENMCHLLIGGTTGSGKSICINSIIMSLLYKADPNEVRLILIDTKAVNLYIYNGIPHLLMPVVTDLKRALAVLNWAVIEMEDRYRKFSNFKIRDLIKYNKVIENYSATEKSLKKLSRIVIVIDDFFDLMIGHKNEVEESICRLAQMGRAAGIHLIISTQRPSVNVITGIIKANMPSRIAFHVFSAIDSRVILDAKGAEDLLGDGDMLFYPQGQRVPLRVQGTFVSDDEVSVVVDFLREQEKNTGNNNKKAYQKVTYAGDDDNGEIDEYFSEAGRFIIEKQKASIGMLQRVYKIGFNRAARIMDQLTAAGVVSPEEGTKPRKVLMTMEEFEEYLKE